MAFTEATQEINKIYNILLTFDWVLSKQEITEDEIILTIKKPKPSSLTEHAPGAD